MSRSYKNVCSVEGCGSPAPARKLCSLHYSRWRVTGDPLVTATGLMRGVRRRCVVKGCDRLRNSALGYCWAHARRIKNNGDTSLRRHEHLPKTNLEGYRKVWDPSHPNAQKDGWILEHRKIMSETLGRSLLPLEIVHHINGDRGDNDPSNLQILTRETHPTGHAHPCPNCGYTISGAEGGRIQ